MKDNTKLILALIGAITCVTIGVLWGILLLLTVIRVWA